VNFEGTNASAAWQKNHRMRFDVAKLRLAGCWIRYPSGQMEHAVISADIDPYEARTTILIL
jgi:hypothetical protein